MFRPEPPRDERELPERFSFEGCEVDLPTARIWRAGLAVHLEPKAFDLLLLLAANRGRIVEKEEIFERIWEGVYVSDNALTRVISHLRHVLGDEPEKPSVIETVRTRGYRFLPEIQKLIPDRSQSTKEAPRSKRWQKAALAFLVVAAVGFALQFRASRQGRESSQVNWRPVRLTVESGFNADPTFSPDGSHIAHIATSADGLDVFVRSTVGGSPQRLTFDGRVKRNPNWSPRGDLIAYEDRDREGIWVVPFSGGMARQLTDTGNQPAFSPDGRTIVFADRAVVHNETWPAQFGSTLWLVDLPRGEPRQLTERNITDGGHGMPSFSPDGKWVVFATGTYTGGQLWRVPVTGGRPEAMVSPRPGDRFTHPVVSPDGRFVYALRLSRAQSREVVRVSLDGAMSEALELAFIEKGVSDLALSPTAESLAFSVMESKSRIQEVAIDGDFKVSASPQTLAAPSDDVRVTRPRYSHDGKMLAYWHYREGAQPDIVVVDRNGDQLWSVRAIEASRAFFFSWLDDGRLVVPAPRDGEQDLIVDVKQRREYELPAQNALADRFSKLRPRHYVIGPDGQRALFTGLVDSARELFVWDANTNSARQVTQIGQTVGWPEWASDGGQAIFSVETFPDLGNELWMLSLPDGDLTQIRAGRGLSWGATRAPNDNRVAYAAFRSGQWHLAIAGPDRAEQLLLSVPTFGYLRWLDWSPSEDRIAYEQTSFQSQIFTVDLSSPEESSGE